MGARVRRYGVGAFVTLALGLGALAPVPAGQAFNMGGGPANTVGFLELLKLIGEINGQRPDVRFSDWRVGDQRYYVSDTRKFQATTGWRPKVGVTEGVERLYRWLGESSDLIRSRALVHGEVA